MAVSAAVGLFYLCLKRNELDPFTTDDKLTQSNDEVFRFETMEVYGL